MFIICLLNIFNYICITITIKKIEIMTRPEAVNYLKDLCSNHVNTQVLDECVGRLNELGWFSEKDERGNVKFINAFTKANVKHHFNNVLYTYE